MTKRASVIVRAKDRAHTIEQTLVALRSQTVDPEIIVVDSGSTDGTVEIARGFCDRLIEIAPSDFTFGGALNIGAGEASAPIHFALSSHAHPKRSDWIERSLAHYERGDVAATNGGALLPDGSPLLETFIQTIAAARAHPLWGYSNHAGSWRAAVWQEFPFNEQMDACEDKEWSWRVLNAGWVIAYDPLLRVSGAHRRREGTRALFRRTLKEQRALFAHADPPPLSARDALHKWWSDYPEDTIYPLLFHRLNYLRMAEIAGTWAGQRQARRARSA